jgi:hypothetical protein
MREKARIPWYRWPFWMTVLALGLLVFYVILTPVWMGIRLVTWVAERGASTLERRPRVKL